MKEYETLFVVKSKVPEGELKELMARLGQVIKKRNGDVLQENYLGKRTLAFPIAKEREGWMMHLDFKGPGEVIGELERTLRYDERVVRFLTTVKRKKAVAPKGEEGTGDA